MLRCGVRLALVLLPLASLYVGSAEADVLSSVGPGAYVRTEPNPWPGQPIGTGGTAGQIVHGAVDFAVSDVPLTDQELKEAGGPILHFPTTLNADVLIYNLPRIPRGQRLRLTGPVIADIYRGKITRWSDRRISAVNPGLDLPEWKIVACHRDDDSGVTYVLADYLSKVSPEWNHEIGRAMILAWPTEQGADGNAAVARLVSRTPGAIGYVELTYALNAKLPSAQIRNAAGQWMDANLNNVTAAAASGAADLPKDFRASITNAPGLKAYPLSSYTYLLVYEQQTDRAKAESIKSFLEWMLHDGQQLAPNLNFAPLPKAVAKREEPQIRRIRLP